ncbi:hypothetical protein SAMN05428642_105162 [Flaviramulus basaltis]|uniref:Uncharacterized protein n=1 Tax=Flaviramulus basaltis TaxID=369401 RepID=A0A1K2IR23_9FLAO|nr:hypothetical protein [Flaviramulus basaltis]SFZ94900.1 hypothetical protein SAMN05428642_105162 [Flaviramulus basaltis]
MTTEIREEFEKLYSKIIHLDGEIYQSGFPFRIIIESWEDSKKFAPKDPLKNTDEIKEYIKHKIGYYPDPRIIYG